MHSVRNIVLTLALAVIVGLLGGYFWGRHASAPAPPPQHIASPPPAQPARQNMLPAAEPAGGGGGDGDRAQRHYFSRCHSGGGRNCVVDGDTIWMDGEKIRLADIDTPETHPARCRYEQQLGDRATARLQSLLNAGPVALAPAADGRSHDRYGRRLAVLTRDGQSLGMILVREGLARRYSGGPRDPWC